VNITKLEYSIYKDSTTLFIKEALHMTNEIKELNRIICNQCDEREYEKCRICKVYQLVNKIAAQ
jgi:hypothetical protein